MTEQEFWGELHVRINQDSALEKQGWYCDWIEPKRYYFGPPDPRIEGEIGFLTSLDPVKRKFSMTLPEESENRSDMQWSDLIPKAGEKGWLEFVQERIVIDTVRSR